MSASAWRFVDVVRIARRDARRGRDLAMSSAARTSETMRSFSSTFST
jgi:hypothetical protein